MTIGQLDPSSPTIAEWQNLIESEVNRIMQEIRKDLLNEQ